MTLLSPPPETLHDAKAAADANADAPKPRARKSRAATKRTRKPKADTAPKTSTSAAARPTALRKKLEDSITTLGAMLLLVNPADGQLVIAGAARQAAALDSLARENPAVKRALERMLVASVYGQLAAAFAPTFLGLAANHGMLPPAVTGLVQMATAPAAAPTSPTDADAAAGGSLLDLIGNMRPEDLAGVASMFGPMAAAMGGGENGGAPFGAVAGMG